MFYINNLFAVVGILGGLLCAIADLIMDVKGPKNKKTGKFGMINSEWENMSHWRFVISNILAMFAIPMYCCGFIALMNYLKEYHKIMPTVITTVFMIGAMGGFMIHTFLCLQPTIFKVLHDIKQEALAEELITKLFRQIYVPFFTLYSMLVIIPALAVMILIAKGILPLPLWHILLNPVVFQIVGIMLRATRIKIFEDAPSCCAASLGLAMYGVLALML